MDLVRELSNEAFLEGDCKYVLVLEAEQGDTTHKTGLSHGSAMRLAEELQREGKIVRIMHAVGSARYEVDRYPLR